MAKNCNLISFIIILFCFMFLLFKVLPTNWMIAPPFHLSVIFFLTLIAFVLAMIGLMNKTTIIAKVRSWITIIISFSLSVILFVLLTFSLIFPSLQEELIQTTTSPDENYRIHLYLTNGGATTSYGIKGYVDGPLWFKKEIYDEYRMDQVEVEWINDSTISINGHTLDLNKGETFAN